jgi:hypothetical protein
MSYKNLIAEVLSAHADQILKAEKTGQDYAIMFPNQEELPSLLCLADHVHAALQPVNPPQSFKDQLQRDLLAAAHLKQAEQTTATQEHFPFLPPKLTVALTMLITLVIGLLFYRSRQQHA